MNCKIKRKSWRRLAASLLAGLCLLTGSGAALAAQAAGAAVTQATSGDATTATPETAQAAPDSEAVVTPETATPEQVTEATPETAASAARFSFTVLDADYQAPASGNIDESLFSIEADEARMPAGEAVPVLLQVVDPAPDSTVTVTLSDGAVFTDSEMAADDGSSYTRTFASGEQASAWMLYVRADGDFTAEAIYAGLDGESLTRTIAVTRYHKFSLFSAFSTRAGEHQYHITDVTNVGGEWLITFEGEDQSYCLDKGMNGKPSASVYWTYYGTTDLLDQALAAGCSSKLDIQRYVWAHRQEASNSGSAYVYQASEAGWQNVMTRYPPVDQPTEPDQPEETPPPTYDANWSVNVSESASAEFAVSMTVAVDKTAAITGERLDDAEITVTPTPASGNLDGGSWSISPDHEIIRTVNGDGSVTFSYKGSVTKSASRSDSGSVSGAASQEEADAAAESERAQAESALRAEARADAQNQANAAAAAAAEQAREFLVKETGVPQGFSATDSSEQTVTVQPNGSVTAAIQNQPWRATVRWEKLDALTGGRSDRGHQICALRMVTDCGRLCGQPQLPRCAAGRRHLLGDGRQRQLHRLAGGLRLLYPGQPRQVQDRGSGVGLRLHGRHPGRGRAVARRIRDRRGRQGCGVPGRKCRPQPPLGQPGDHPQDRQRDRASHRGGCPVYAVRVERGARHVRGQHQLCDRAGRGRQLHRRLPAPGLDAGRSRAALF